MRLWILSDLHIEQSLWDLPDHAPEYDVLIAAGDIHDPLSGGVRWLAERARGRPVIYVPGNHEWYAHPKRFTVAEEAIRGQHLADALGVHLLQEAKTMIDGVRFLGTTLWTDYAVFGHPAAGMHYARNGMNDHWIIFPDDEGMPLSPELALTWHERSLAWLKAKLQEPFAGKTVVVSHHLPHPSSIHPRFVDDQLTPAFCSDLSEVVESSGAVLWVHGHTHESCDYVAGVTRVVCNPKGYGPIRQGGRFENAQFDPCLVVEV